MSDTDTFVQLLRTVPREWRAVLDRRLAPLGLSQAKWQPLLYLLRADGPPTQAELARFLDVESPTVVRMLDRLEADGWIRRQHCPGDRRARRIHLTERASAVCAEIERAVLDVRRQLLSAVSADELAQCTSVLQRISQAAATLTAADAGAAAGSDEAAG